MDRRHRPRGGQLDQRPLGVEFRVLGAIEERHGRAGERGEVLGRFAAQLRREREAIGEQAVAALVRGHQGVQSLKSRHRLAVGIVGVQPEPEIGVGEVLRLRHRAHVEDEAVVGLEHATDQRHDLKNRAFPRRNLLEEGESILHQAREPREARARHGRQRGHARPGEIPPRIEALAFEPGAHPQFRPLYRCVRAMSVQPVGG